MEVGGWKEEWVLEGNVRGVSRLRRWSCFVRCWRVELEGGEGARRGGVNWGGGTAYRATAGRELNREAEAGRGDVSRKGI